MRELERQDQQYKKVFSEYLDALTDNKRFLERFADLEKRLTQQNYINNATI